MWAADREPAETHRIVVWTLPEGQEMPVPVEFPDSWKVNQAALAVLNASVTVN